jgi:ATP-binding cassette subfamily A (ABC1) protein 3
VSCNNNLRSDEGNLLVLLGHNGAGKTTTIGMLTGLLSPTSGDALIFGNSIITDMDEIRKVMGVCPQYDILWPQMTGREHLELFAALKEVSKDHIENEVVERLNDVDLLKAQNIPSGSYSGGMKRRLSVAIALIGNPKIVFLDEPTTGMDPVSR